MTSPQATDTANESLGYRHLRTGVGLLFMIAGPAFVIAGHIINILPATQCASNWADTAQEYGFPIVLFMGGLLLFNRAAFGDLVAAGKGLIPSKS